MGLPPPTRTENDRETLTHRGRTGGLPFWRLAALMGFIVAVAAAGLYGQRPSSGPNATGSPNSSPANSNALGASPIAASPFGTVPVPTPMVVPLTPSPVSTEDTGGLPQVQPPLYSLRATRIFAWIGGAASVSGSRFYVLDKFGIGVVDPSAAPAEQWSQLRAPVPCRSMAATIAAADNRLIYAFNPPGAGAECDALHAGWRFELADTASGSVHEVKAVVGTIANSAGDPPPVAISSDIYAFAYKETTFKTIVEVHALSTEKLLWSATLPGQVQSLTAGGSRILLSLFADASAQAGSYPAMTQISWMDPSHHDPQPLGVALGAASLSLDGSTAAWFDAAKPGRHLLDVENLATGKLSSQKTLSDETQARSCLVAVDVVQGQTTVAWTPTDMRGSPFLAISDGDGTAYELIGLPRLSWIGLQGRTLAAISDSGPEAITIDLDLAYTVPK